MKVVLANLPWKKGRQWGVRAGSRWPHIKDNTETHYLPFPFYLAYAAALLKKHAFDVQLIDAIAEQLPYKEFYQKVIFAQPDLLIAETSTVSLKHDLICLAQFKRQIPIALCGPDVNITNPEFLNQFDYINYVLFGEYEATLLELVTVLKDKLSLSGIKGIIYKNNRDVIKNPSRPLIQDLDWLPWPLREQLPIKKYNDSPGDIPLPCVSMWASRGCPFRCSFCLWPQVMYAGNTYRTRNVNCVVDEMEYLVKKLGFKSIYFDDDTWNIGKERIFNFCDELLKRELKIPWAIMARAELMDEELLEKMRRVGLFAVKYGVESASQKLLNNINKGSDLKKIEEIVKYTKYLGIRTHLTFTFGLPEENENTIRVTMDFTLKLNPTSVQFSLATPFPGTRFFEKMQREGYVLTKNWQKYDGNHSSVIRTENLTARQLQKAKKNAYKIWDKHCQLRYKKIFSKNKTLKEKFLSSLKTYGILFTGLKSIRYILKRIFFMPYRLRQFLGKKLWIIEEEIYNGKLKLFFGEGRVRLYWKNKEISKDVGLNTSLHCGTRWVDSSQANWKLEKLDKNKIKVKLKWDEIPVRQEWLISIQDNNSIMWSSKMQIDEDLEILEQKAGIVVLSTYDMWKDGLGQGQFPKITDWEEIELYNPRSLKLAVFSPPSKNGNFLPELELHLLSDFNNNTYPQLQNTNRKINARILQMRRFKIEKFIPGAFDYFNLELNLKDNNSPVQSVADYRKKIPFKFIKEQINSKGLSPILWKIVKHLSPKKISNYYLDIIGILDGSYAYKGPAFVQIDLTNNCNNNCIGCWCNSVLLGEKRIEDNVRQQTLPFEIVKQLIDELQQIGTKEIYFAGGGEPLMHPHFLSILEHAKSKGLSCYLNTNFTLVTEDIVKRLVELKVNNLIVSVWAGTAKTYFSTHPNKSEEMFYQIKGMLKLLNSLKKETPYVNIYNVISNHNYNELEKMVEFAIESNSNSVEFTVIDTIPNATDALILTDQQRKIVSKSCERIKQRLNTDFNGKIKVLQFEQFIRRVSGDDAQKANYDKNILAEMPCYNGWLFARILADGNVNFCLKAHRIPVGNIYAHDFSYIWNGKKQQEFRKRALCSAKDDVFFSFIGNDPKAKVGCFKSCDDLARNINMHKKIQSLSSLEIHLLKLILYLKKIQRYLKDKGVRQVIKEQINKQKIHNLNTLQKGRLALICHQEGIRLFWKNEELTQSVGLNSSVCIFGLWYDSSKATWTIEKKTEDEFIIRSLWRSIPISQELHLKIESEVTVLWGIRLFVDSKIEIEEKKVSIMLSCGYKEWATEKEKGKFPIITNNWNEIRIKYLDTAKISAMKTKFKKIDLPEIQLDFSLNNCALCPQIQNSNKIINSRVLSAKRQEDSPNQVLLPGVYDFFKGKIIIKP